MKSRKLFGIALSIVMIASLLFQASGQAQISVAAPIDAVAPISPTDESKVPHYFGPYPNWANSPQVLADAIVTITPART